MAAEIAESQITGLVTTAADLVAPLALLVSLLSLFIAARSYRVARAAHRLSVSRGKPEALPHIYSAGRRGWFVLALSIRSRDQRTYSAERIAIDRPRGARLLPHAYSMFEGQAGGDGSLKEEIREDSGSKSVAMHVEVSHSGSPSTCFFVLFVPSSRRALSSLAFWRSDSSMRLKMRVTLRSSDASEADITVPVVSTLNVADANAAAIDR
ncbi:MAG: hypothetical protein DI565_00560 [Ancylobacter novellus]|uniref:Uncharacterized protein n=1 Tax=Ancylobacter novellus TaxID=921 RepID=A0A2W5KPD7_ANCNO|nr:MAG: hypothetical protein DI565_00560 [Ancylobacter novellus]